MADQVALMTGNTPLLPVALAIPYLLLILTIAALVFCIFAWKDSYWHISGRVHYTVVTAAALVFMWVLAFWNLLLPFL
jgi:hypothetical protein